MSTTNQTALKHNQNVIRTVVTNTGYEQLQIDDERVRDADIECDGKNVPVHVHVPLTELDTTALNPGDDLDRNGKPQPLSDALGVDSVHSELVNALAPLMNIPAKNLIMLLKKHMTCVTTRDDVATFYIMLHTDAFTL